jgi:hypothetical protein
MVAAADKSALTKKYKVFDTVAITGGFRTLPDINMLEKNGCKLFLNRDGEVYKIVLNGEIGAKEPRLTITQSRYGFYWRLEAEVSIGAWLFGSNIYLPSEIDLPIFLSLLSDFIYFKIGIRLKINECRITILDATRDFKLTRSQVTSILKELSYLEIPKYDRRPFNDTSVYFVNKGNIKNKIYKIYDKQHERINNGASLEEIEVAEGVLRLEIHHGDNRAVSNLAKSLRLSDHNAGTILTKETSESVINDAMKLLGLEQLLNNKSDSKLITLARNFDKSMPLILAGHLAFKKEYGLNYAKTLGFNLSDATIKGYERLCVKTGTSSL